MSAKTTSFTYGVIPEANKKSILIRTVVTQDEIDDAKKAVADGTEGAAELDVIDLQSFNGREVSEETPTADLISIVPDLKEQANLINRGLVLKAQQKARQILGQGKAVEAFKRDAVDGFYDLADELAKVSERQAASPLEKLARVLSALSPEDLAAAQALFAQASSGAPEGQAQVGAGV